MVAVRPRPARPCDPAPRRDEVAANHRGWPPVTAATASPGRSPHGNGAISTRSPRAAQGTPPASPTVVRRYRGCSKARHHGQDRGTAMPAAIMPPSWLRPNGRLAASQVQGERQDDGGGRVRQDAQPVAPCRTGQADAAGYCQASESGRLSACGTSCFTPRPSHSRTRQVMPAARIVTRQK
jgi:hypothetical protein